MVQVIHGAESNREADGRRNGGLVEEDRRQEECRCGA